MSFAFYASVVDKTPFFIIFITIIRMPYIIMAIVALLSFAVGGAVVYVGTANNEPIAKEETVAEDFNTETMPQITEEEIVEVEPEPEPPPKIIEAPPPPPPPPPQPAAVITVIEQPKPKIVTLPGGAVAEVDAQGNVIRYISGDPNAAPPPPPPPPPTPPPPHSAPRPRTRRMRAQASPRYARSPR